MNCRQIISCQLYLSDGSVLLSRKNITSFSQFIAPVEINPE
jgi:hypothetical protein